MSIGLNADELMQIFFASFAERIDVLNSKIAGAQTGENPQVKEMVDKAIENIRKNLPSVPNPELLTGLSVILGTALASVMDAVVANNDELQKSISDIAHH